MTTEEKEETHNTKKPMLGRSRPLQIELKFSEAEMWWLKMNEPATWMQCNAKSPEASSVDLP
jgi:hypothetical protein